MAGPYELQSPKDIAMEYGGNKQKIARAAQMGMIDPTAAVLAGMFIDKMRNAQQEEMAPQSTVAQDVMTPPMAGLGATPQMAQMASPQMPMAPQMSEQMPAEAGVAALPVPDEMVPNEFAGGGIVAFDQGGPVARYQAAGLVDYSQFGPLGKRIQEEERLREAYLGKDQSVADLMSYVQGLEGKAGERADRMFNLRLAQAGLGMAAGESPYALQNIARGAAPAIAGYGEDVAKQEEAELGRKKVLAELGGRARAEKVGVLGEAKKAEETAAERASRERQAELDRVSRERIANMPPDIIRAAKAIQQPNESLEAAVSRYSDIVNTKDQYNAAAGLVKSAFDAGSKRFTDSVAAGGSNYQLALAAGGNEKALRDLKLTREQANEAIDKLREQYVKEAYSGIGMDPKTANQYLRRPRGAPSANNPLVVTTPDGQTFSFPTQEQADAFRRRIQGQ